MALNARHSCRGNYTGVMRNKVAVALVALAFLAGLAVSAVLGLLLMRRQAAPQIAGTATVIQQIQTLSELVTVKYVMQKVVLFTNAPTTTLGALPNVMKFPGFDEDRVTLLAHGVAKAGVDLSQLKPEDVSVSGRSIALRLPPGRLTDSYLDEAQTQVLDRKAGLFRTFEKTLEQQARQYARSEMGRAARQGGIEKEAEQRATELIERLLRTMGFEKVEVR